MKTLKSLTPFKHLCMTIGNLPSSYVDSMSYYECLMWLCKFLKDEVIPTVNNNSEAVEELQEFVTHYFDNLDVQEEINNKLDDMAKDGSLNRLIGNYINPYLTQFNTAIDNQNSTIQALNTKVDKATSGSPLVASSTSGMTDTTRIYVNTTDGKWYYYNGTAWTIGGTYQASEDSATVTLLIDEFDYMNKAITPLANFMDNANTSQNSLWQANSSSVVQRKTRDTGWEQYCAVPKFPVKKGVSYTVDILAIAKAFSYFADANGNVIEAFSTATNPTIHKFIAPADGYAYVSGQNANVAPLNTSMIFVENHAPSSFKTYGVIYDVLILDENFKDVVNVYKSLENKVALEVNINVGVNETYTTISDAIASITDASKNKIYNVLIEDGTYEEQNINVPDYVNLVGISGNADAVIIKGSLPETASDNDMAGNSTINFSYNNELRNLTVTAKNMRYPIHDETNGVYKNWIQVVDNCKIIHYGNKEVVDYRASHSLPAGSPWSSPHAWGMGASSGCNLTIKNSYLESPEYPFYTHAATNFEKAYLITIENTSLISTDLLDSIYIDNSTSPISNNKLVVKDCLMNSRYAIITPANISYDAIISGSGNRPVYQAPGRVLESNGFPKYTDYDVIMKASENLTKGTFVKSTDGVHVVHADSSTPLKDIVGYVIGSASNGGKVYIHKGYIQPTAQTWPETEMVIGKMYKLNSQGQLTETTNVNDNIIGKSESRWIRLYI